jgi:hypothetical protein
MRIKIIVAAVVLIVAASLAFVVFKLSGKTQTKEFNAAKQAVKARLKIETNENTGGHGIYHILGITDSENRDYVLGFNYITVHKDQKPYAFYMISVLISAPARDVSFGNAESIDWLIDGVQVKTHVPMKARVSADGRSPLPVQFIRTIVTPEFVEQMIDAKKVEFQIDKVRFTDLKADDIAPMIVAIFEMGEADRAGIELFTKPADFAREKPFTGIN